jgi:hypothetical protein
MRPVEKKRTWTEIGILQKIDAILKQEESLQ